MPRVISKITADAIEAATKRYPTRLAALLPALHLVQDELGWISTDAQLDVAEVLDIPPTRVHEVVTFYTMFYDEPTGRHIVKLCRNLACQLRGSDVLIKKAQEHLGVQLGETTPDGRVTLETDECLASCGTGPMLWCRTFDKGAVTERVVENLTEEKLTQFLGALK
jgi:NADH-quinone oxidoreductase subunit E